MTVVASVSLSLHEPCLVDSVGSVLLVFLRPLAPTVLPPLLCGVPGTPLSVWWLVHLLHQLLDEASLVIGHPLESFSSTSHLGSAPWMSSLSLLLNVHTPPL